MNGIRISAALLVLTACATSPTGRKQLTLLPESQMAQMGAEAFRQQKEQTPASKDPAINAFVRCVSVPLIEEVTGKGSARDWEIVVFDVKEPNAFALPGKKIGVQTGILSVARTDGQLAAVLGHEIGHVLAKHGNERVSQGIGAQVLTMGAAAALGKDSPEKSAILAGLGIATQFGVLLPFSRTHESEADVLGLDIMARAGFDPRQSVELWKNMSAAGGAKPPEWMSTHPADQSRIEHLQKNMAGAMTQYEHARAQGKAPHCQL